MEKILAKQIFEKRDTASKIMEGIETTLDSKNNRVDVTAALSGVFTLPGAPDAFVQAMWETVNSQSFANHCKDATQAFAHNLAAAPGKKSFFEISEDTELYDMRSSGPFTPIAYRGDYHSVAVVRQPKEQDTSWYTIVDLTRGHVAGTVNRGSIFVASYIERLSEVEKMLTTNYGGMWRQELYFDAQKDRFSFV